MNAKQIHFADDKPQIREKEIIMRTGFQYQKTAKPCRLSFRFQVQVGPTNSCS